MTTNSWGGARGRGWVARTVQSDAVSRNFQKNSRACRNSSSLTFEMEEEDLRTWPSIWAWEAEGGGCLRVVQLAAARSLEAKGLAVPRHRGELDFRHVSKLDN